MRLNLKLSMLGCAAGRRDFFIVARSRGLA
jgi:hypothetical protein